MHLLYKNECCWALVVLVCNSSYSGGRDQEDRGSDQSRQIVCETLSRKAHDKKGLVEWLKI
jgi:hypothetical protein